MDRKGDRRVDVHGVHLDVEVCREGVVGTFKKLSVHHSDGAMGDGFVHQLNVEHSSRNSFITEDRQWNKKNGRTGFGR